MNIEVEELKKFNIGEKISIAEKDEKDFDEILLSDRSLTVIKRYSDKTAFEDNWKETVHFTAGYIQNNLEKLGFNQVLAWDIYILYLINFDLDSNLISLIEKDKYCCKKYVINTDGYSDEYKAISSKIPLFASFNDNLVEDQTSFNDSDVKNKIVEGNDSIVAQYFKKIDFVDDDMKCDKLLEILKGLYINEKNKENSI